MRITSVTAHEDRRRSPQELRRRPHTLRNDARWQDAQLVGRAIAHAAIALAILAVSSAYLPAVAGAPHDVAASAREVLATFLSGLFQTFGWSGASFT